MPTITSGSAASATGAAVVVTNNTATLLTGCRGLYVGTAGDVTARVADGGVITFRNVPAGTILPISLLGVNTTGTTAADMVALF